MMPMQPQPRYCAPCLIASNQWASRYKPAIEAAQRAAEEAVQKALAEGRQPTQEELNPAAYLPEEVRATAPQVNPAATLLNGTEVCAGHLPGAPGQSGLVAAPGGLSGAALAGLRR
jgi:hypothetical protein